MALRKNRSVGMGKTSSDVRTALENKTERKSRLPLHESVYPYYKSSLGLSRVKTLPDIIKDPILTQTNYYKNKNKRMLTKQNLEHPSPPEFGKSVQLITDKINKNPNRSPNLNDSHSEKKINKYHVSKEVEHKKASQETQLVHIEHHSTLEGKVDLKKVADIRRTIRRRYANRNDFRKIFNQWDENSIGVLTAEDIHKMVNRIGIPVNINEAKVLVASANKSNTGALNLNEFMGLIFDQDDKLNVDLATLAENDNKNFSILDMHNIAVNKHTQMLQNQLKSYLKDKIYGLAPQFSRKDKRKTGKITFEEFVNIMNNMDIPHTLSSEKNFKLLFKEQSNELGLDYKNFLEDLDNFVPVQLPEEPEKNEEAEKVEPNEQLKVFVSAPQVDPLKNLNVLNRQKVPVNQLENFFVRARKIRLFLRDSMENEKRLHEELLKIGKNGVIELHQLKQFVIDKLQEKKTLKVTKKELEGFLSSYIYNNDGVTPIEEVSKNVFMEDTKASFELYQIKRPVAPIRDKYEEVKDLENIKKVLEKIEEKFYTQGCQKANDIFKKFDMDRDGYITLEDLRKALEIHQIVHSPSDITNLMAFLDTGQNGYVSFHEFSNKIRPNIISLNKDRLNEIPEKHMESYKPSLEFLTKQKQNIEHYSQIQEDFIKDFRPDDKIIKFQSNTRYGAKPPHQDTFVHYHMPLTSSMSQDTIIPKKILPFNIGADEKNRKLELEEKKISNLKKRKEDRILNLQQIEENVDKKYAQKINYRAASKDDYEKRCKLTSPFANMSIE